MNIHTVILNNAFYEQHGYAIAHLVSTEGKVRQLVCTQVDFSSFSYLGLTVSTRETGEPQQIHLPHAWVLAVLEVVPPPAPAANPIGFVSRGEGHDEP